MEKTHSTTGSQLKSQSNLFAPLTSQECRSVPSLASSLHVSAEEKDFRRYLQSELIRRTRQNPRYSLRAFARALQTDFSSLGKMIRGKRPLGKNVILRLGIRMGLPQHSIDHYVLEFQSQKMTGTGQSKKAAQKYSQMSQDHFQIISDWYHHAILELIRVDGFELSAKNIGRTLGLSVVEVQAALDRLIRVGQLEITPDGKWLDIAAVESRSTTLVPNATSQAARSLQKQILEKAIIALDEVPIEGRDNTSMTIAIDSDLLPEAKKRITAFRRELAQFLSRGQKRDQVYNLGIVLYPVSQEKVKAVLSNSESP